MPPRKTSAVDAAALIAAGGDATGFVSTAKPTTRTRAPSSGKKSAAAAANTVLLPTTSSVMTRSSGRGSANPSAAEFAAQVSAFSGDEYADDANAHVRPMGSSYLYSGGAAADGAASSLRSSAAAPSHSAARRSVEPTVPSSADAHHAHHYAALTSHSLNLVAGREPSAVLSRASSMGSIGSHHSVSHHHNHQPHSATAGVSNGGMGMLGARAASVASSSHNSSFAAGSCAAVPQTTAVERAGSTASAHSRSYHHQQQQQQPSNLCSGSMAASGATSLNISNASAGSLATPNTVAPQFGAFGATDSLPTAAAAAALAGSSRAQTPLSASAHSVTVKREEGGEEEKKKILSASATTNTTASSRASSIGSTSAAEKRASASASAETPAQLALRAVIQRCDDLADLSVLSSGGSLSASDRSASSAAAAPTAVRRAVPTSSAFMPAPSVTAALRAAAASPSAGGGPIAGLFNPRVDVGTGAPSDPIRTPHYPAGGTNDSGCAHCTHTTHCDCEYVADVFYDVFEHQLTQKRITERSASSANNGGASSAAASAAQSRSRSTTADAGAADHASSSSSANGGYNAVPAALSAKAVTSKTMMTGTSTRHLCAKSLLPPFVARLIRLLDLQPGDTFYDFGCGNGSILFQAALSAGATCVGIELCPHNAQLARDAWSLVKPIFEAKLSAAYPPQPAAKTRRAATAAASASATPNVGMPHLEIITGDVCSLLADPAFFSRPRKILLSNLLFPKELTHFIATQCRRLPKGSKIVCFDDLYPHGRSVCRVRDPEAFALFHMTDYEWPRSSVEWCYQEGRFYIHTKKE